MEYRKEYLEFLLENNRLCYSQLSEESKTKARNQYIEVHKAYFNKNIQKRKNTGLHEKINRPQSYKNLLKNFKNLKRILTEEKYLVASIEQNLVEFDSEGVYLDSYSTDNRSLLEELLSNQCPSRLFQ